MSDSVDSILQSILGGWAKSFGMAAVVLRGDCIVAQGVAGVRKKGASSPRPGGFPSPPPASFPSWDVRSANCDPSDGEGVACTLEDRFHIGSCGKAMTATLAAVLVEEGRLSWTDTVGRIFRGAIQDIHPAWEKITLPQLLAHCAGLRCMADRALRARVVSSQESLPQQRLEIARHTLGRPPDRPPRTKFSLLSYSNLGYVVAAAALEHITGRAWEELMRERLFQPLGITTGGFGQPGTGGKTDQPWGHAMITGRPFDPENTAADWPGFYRPAGLIHMTVADWAKFVGIHLRGDPANPHRQATLLKPETFAELHSNATAGTYSAGWFTTASWVVGGRAGDMGRCLWHAGSDGKWISGVLVAPEIDFAVLIACNQAAVITVWKARQAAKALIRRFGAKTHGNIKHQAPKNAQEPNAQDVKM